MFTAVTETPCGVVVLGASTLFGIEIKGVDTLQQCIQKCVTAGKITLITSLVMVASICYVKRAPRNEMK